MRGIVAPVFGLCAVAFLILGVLNATVWRPATDITAAVRISGTRYVVTDPGVLGLVDSSTRLRATATDASSTVCVALGSAQDVMGWVAGSTITRVTGMSNWTTLSTESYEAPSSDSSASSSVEFQDSDMWTASRCGEGAVTLSATSTASQVAVIDLGSSSDSGSVSLSWVQIQPPDFAMPFYFLAVLSVALTILSASVFALPPERRRKVTTTDHHVHTHKDRPEEVAIRDAVKGTLAVLASWMPTGLRKGKTRRHGPSHRQVEGDGALGIDGEASGSDESRPDGPVVVDPTVRSMVVEAADPGSHATPVKSEQTVGREDRSGKVGDDVEQTSVISPDELSVYFARLASETGDAEATGNDDQERQGGRA
ncbi:hypothetical protein [uncultured Bifidobacterium sp.]|uniref:hypothetical protein n=1 Tax=uncultured Bifidobacterium sp. TaxID=165187 RepID=UPI002602A767|nr:hypothetical protein [uncultured Bifidobacterium sp.]